MTCPDCGKGPVSESYEGISFPIVNGVELYAVVPVMFCMGCAFSWTDYRAEEIRDETVRIYNDKQKAMETPIRRGC
jgi:hypothetical protein